MGAQGNTTADFGAFPGKSDVSITITGQTAIVAGSAVEAWIRAEASSDHSADEHFLETISVTAGTITAGTGFVITLRNSNQINPNHPNTLQKVQLGTASPTIYGVWNVSWVWN